MYFDASPATVRRLYGVHVRCNGSTSRKVDSFPTWKQKTWTDGRQACYLWLVICNTDSQCTSLFPCWCDYCFVCLTERWKKSLLLIWNFLFYLVRCAQFRIVISCTTADRSVSLRKDWRAACLLQYEDKANMLSGHQWQLSLTAGHSAQELMLLTPDRSLLHAGESLVQHQSPASHLWPFEPLSLQWFAVNTL